MALLYILFENATGYSLFRVPDLEETSVLSSKILNKLGDFDTFKSLVELAAFHTFSTGQVSLENINSSSEGILHPDLQQFLENNLPKSKKKHPVTLGVNETKLAVVISEVFGISCSFSGIVPILMRGIRLHYHHLVKSVKNLDTVLKARIGLSHSYCRAKVKFNVNKIDNMIIQSISIIDQLDKDINNFSMRVREWYSHHFPELIKVVPENHLYVQCVSAIKDRKNMPEDIIEKLENILMDSGKAQTIIEIARSSMGMEISALDMENVSHFAERISALMNRRKELMEYLKSKMHNVAPNLATLIGDIVGARLIAHAGSLINLAKFPASTVQILGAEKALFRALKTRGNTPKYGLIYHSTFIGRAGKTNKGRISRYLANKCSVASRIDCFREIPTEVFGTKLRQQVEDRLKFYETGAIPAKNVDVMTVALGEAEDVAATLAKEKRKAEKREKKRRSQLLESIAQTSFNISANAGNDENDISPKKKKKSQSGELENNSESFVNNDANENNQESSEINVASPDKKKKKRKHAESFEVEEKMPLKKVKIDEEMEEITDPEILRQIKKAKKKEKKRLRALQESMNCTGDDSVLTNNSSMFTNDSINSTMNTTANTTANTTMNTSNDDHLDNSISKKKKKKKNKKKKQQEEADEE